MKRKRKGKELFEEEIEVIEEKEKKEESIVTEEGVVIKKPKIPLITAWEELWPMFCFIVLNVGRLLLGLLFLKALPSIANVADVLLFLVWVGYPGTILYELNEEDPTGPFVLEFDKWRVLSGQTYNEAKKTKKKTEKRIKKLVLKAKCLRGLKFALILMGISFTLFLFFAFSSDAALSKIGVNFFADILIIIPSYLVTCIILKYQTSGPNEPLLSELLDFDKCPYCEGVILYEEPKVVTHGGKEETRREGYCSMCGRREVKIFSTD